MTMWTDVTSAARDLLLGETCAGCGGAAVVHGLCRVCDTRLVPAVAAVHPRVELPGFPPTTAAARYDGVVRRVIVAHKEDGRLALVGCLGRLLAAAVRTASDGAGVPRPTALVPVPSRRGATRARGHDPVLRMARLAARRVASGRAAGPVRVVPMLRHQRRVADQSGLGVDARRRNLDGAFRAASVRGARRWLGDPDTLVVVVDDVCSSGATLAAAASALVCAGHHASSIAAAVVAAPPLRSHRDATALSGPWPATAPQRSGLA